MNNQIKDIILGTPDWVIVSADRAANTPDQNETARGIFERMLDLAGPHYIRGTGAYNGEEEISYLLTGLRSRDGEDIARVFQQESFLCIDGLVFTDGSTVKPIVRVQFFSTKAEAELNSKGGYSAFGGVYFTFDLED